MAAKSQGVSSVQSELRIVILGNPGDDKNKVVKSVLNCENLTGVKVGLCTLHQREQAGRTISVVEAPGWDRTSIKQTPENIKEEVERSVTLFPQGPHALLLVIPVKNLSEEPSTGEITAAQTHIELLPERVWKHTILLFACDEGVEEPQIKEHIRSTDQILEKCGGRYYVLQKNTHDLLKKIDDLVEENRGDFFIPLELIQHKTKVVASGGRKLRHRQRSLRDPPNLNKDKGDAVEKKETIEAAKHTPLEDIPKLYMDPKKFVLIQMGMFGALIGAVAGAQNGVSGSCTGLVFGAVDGILLACFFKYFYTHIYPRSYPKKPTHS